MVVSSAHDRAGIESIVSKTSNQAPITLPSLRRHIMEMKMRVLMTRSFAAAVPNGQQQKPSPPRITESLLAAIRKKPTMPSPKQSSGHISQHDREHRVELNEQRHNPTSAPFLLRPTLIKSARPPPDAFAGIDDDDSSLSDSYGPL